MSENLHPMRHSAAHLLAAAVKNLYPKTTLGIGPVIDNGFYYDFDSRHKFSEDDFGKIEKEIAKLKKDKLPFEKSEKSIPEALKIAKEAGEPYKEELINDLKERGEKKVSFYKSGPFVDLCNGPHVRHSGLVGPVKLLSAAGAYWKGSEKNKMLQRIYGTAWGNQKDLENYLLVLEEAKKRDHKKIGRELSLFTFLAESPGMPYWYPNGLVLVRKLKELIRKLNTLYGYQEIATPLLAKKEVWEASGHWKLFRENMFAFDIDKQTYALKPMNCPQTLLLYNTKQFSYRDLPLKLADLDVLHRFEDSGTLNGLFRVRQLCQDDGHVICSFGQSGEIIEEILEMALKIYKVFDLTPSFYLSTRPDKALGDLKSWDRAEEILEKSLKRKNINYNFKPGEGSFYGPKIDLHIEDSLGRDWQLSTLQLDTQMPERFGSTYADKDGKNKTPVMIHRALLGSLERFIGILIEHLGGTLPVWIAPIQVRVLPITDRNIEYANKVSAQLLVEDLRADTDRRNETLQAKIRDAQSQKIPFMLVVGDKEQVQKKVSVRDREKGDLGVQSLEQFISNVESKVKLPL